MLYPLVRTSSAGSFVLCCVVLFLLFWSAPQDHNRRECQGGGGVEKLAGKGFGGTSSLFVHDPPG